MKTNTITNAVPAKMLKPFPQVKWYLKELLEEASQYEEEMVEIYIFSQGVYMVDSNNYLIDEFGTTEGEPIYTHSITRFPVDEVAEYRRIIENLLEKVWKPD